MFVCYEIGDGLSVFSRVNGRKASRNGERHDLPSGDIRFRGARLQTRARASLSSVGSSFVPVLYKTCILCDVVLTVDNRSEILNLCYECWHGLTR